MIHRSNVRDIQIRADNHGASCRRIDPVVAVDLSMALMVRFLIDVDFPIVPPALWIKRPEYFVEVEGRIIPRP